MPTVLSDAHLEVLFRCHLFQNIDSDWLLAVLDDDRCRCQTYPKASLICGGHQFERSLGILLSGQIRVTRTSHDGKQLPFSIQSEGAMFGMAVLFCSANEFPTELCSVSRCKVLYLEESLLSEMMRQQFQIAENYIRYLSSRIHFLNSRIEGLSAGDCTHKLAQWLMANVSGGTATLPSMSRLAQELNIGRASLYRAMDALEAAHAIRRDEKTVTILDPTQLQKLHSNHMMV